MLLRQEMIEVFDAQVLIVLDFGAGELLKATLAQSVFGDGVCFNAHHKLSS